jgi:probable F420-dependent oxidoreductase
MRFTVQFPLDDAEAADAAVDAGQVAEFAQVAEASGFNAIAFTEHPAPPPAWLFGSYGHASLDPFCALSYCAAVTTRIRLLTYLSVLPYRHPLVTAKAATTVDRLSNGRLILGIGAGYLREEFQALGTPFDGRTERFEGAVAALAATWSGAAVLRTAQGATEVALRPRSVQRPGPPLWIGGNSRRSRRMVARHGAGWTPLLVDDRLAGELSTSGIDSVERLRDAVTDLHDLVAAAGRDPSTIDVQVKGSFSRVALEGFSPGGNVDTAGRLAEAGATWLVVHPMAPTRAGLLDVLRRYGADVISKLSDSAKGDSHDNR